MTNHGETPPGEGIREISRRLLHRGRKFDFELLSVQMPGGSRVEREIVRHGGSAVILPLLHTSSGTAVVFVRNHRFSIARPLLEIPAGTLEPGEDPAACAARELVEETGYRAEQVRPMLSFLPTPGMTDERMNLFVATGLSHVGQDLEEDESMSVEVVAAGLAIEMASDGRLEDGKSILALLLAQRLRLLD